MNFSSMGFALRGKTSHLYRSLEFWGLNWGLKWWLKVWHNRIFQALFGKPVGNSTHQCTEMNGVWTEKKNSLYSRPYLTDLVSYVATIQMIYLPISHQVPDLLTYLHSTYSPSLPTYLWYWLTYTSTYLDSVREK
jgi:hypothetical protein